MRGKTKSFGSTWRRWRRRFRRITAPGEVLLDFEVITGRRYLARGTHPDALDTVRVLTVFADEDPPYLYIWSEGQGKYGYLELERIVELAPEKKTEIHIGGEHEDSEGKSRVPDDVA